MIRVCLVEDQPKTRDTLVKLLRLSEAVVCVGAFASAGEAEREIPKLQPDIVLMDINLGGERTGIDCVAKLKIEHPKIQILMLTTYDDNDLIFKSLQAGACGYLLKTASAKDLLKAIADLHEGGSPMSPHTARKLVAYFQQIRQPSGEMDTLTPREHEILGLLSKALSYKEIADQLGVTFRTVQAHLHTIYGKLHVQTRTEAILKFLRK